MRTRSRSQVATTACWRDCSRARRLALARRWLSDSAAGHSGFLTDRDRSGCGGVVLGDSGIDKVLSSRGWSVWTLRHPGFGHHVVSETPTARALNAKAGPGRRGPWGTKERESHCGPPRATVRPATLSICRRRQRFVTTGNRDRQEGARTSTTPNRRRSGRLQRDPRRSSPATPRNTCKCPVGRVPRSRGRGRRQTQTVGSRAFTLGGPNQTSSTSTRRPRS